MKNVVLSLAASLLALMIAEVAMRLLVLYRPPPWPPEPRRAGYYRADPETGYRLWPSSRTCERYPENGGPILELVSNSDGFRSSRELGDRDPRPRVVVLGDSFVFGSGVEEGERLTEVLERLEPRWRVENLGMTGFGIDLMVRTLDALGAKARPDVVVLGVYTHDYVRQHPQYSGMGYATRKFELADGQLRDVAHTPPTRFRRLRLWQAYLDFRNRLDPNHLRLNEALFDRFRERTLELGAQPVALFLPGRGDSIDDRLRREHLRDWAKRAGVPFRDLTDVIASAGIENTYIPDNYHWNKHGHEVAGRALRELLLDATPLAQRSAAIDAGSIAPPAWPRVSFCRDIIIQGPDPLPTASPRRQIPRDAGPDSRVQTSAAYGGAGSYWM